MKLYIVYFLLFWILCEAQFKYKECYSEAGIGCEVYYNLTAEGCASLHNHFPDLYYREDGLYPNKPSLFHLTPIEQQYTNTIYRGANVTFKVPLDVSFQAVKGFELFRRSVSPLQTTSCYIFALNGTDLNSTTKNGEIQFKIWPIRVQRTTEFEFEVFSLPKPPEHEYNGMSLKKSIVIQREYSLSGVPSSNWVTTISYYSSSAERYIYIEFAKPPDQYGFKNFRIILVELDENGFDKSIAQEKVISDYIHWFNHVKPGRYKVTVQPESSYDDCFCYNEHHLCVTCTATATKQMIIENITATTTSTSTSTETETEQLFPTPDDDETLKILAAVLGSVIGILLVVIMGYFIYTSRRKHSCLFKLTQPLDNAVPDDRSSTGAAIPTYIPVKDDNIKIPTVYLFSAEDHPKHVKAVEAFARFIDNYFQCRMIYAPWCLHEVLDDKFRWVINTIERADYVIIVNSELSYQQFKSWKNKENREWKPSESSRTFDLFLSSVNQITKHIINVNNHFKCIVVHFGYTSNKYSLSELCTGAEYLIPNHMHELMCHIHKIDSRLAGYDNYGYINDQVASTPDGKYLMQCINSAENYEKEHPDWFSEYYENTRDQYDSGISITSTSLGDSSTNIKKCQNQQVQPIGSDLPANIQIHQNCDYNLQPENNLSDCFLPRQRSTEDNTAYYRQQNMRYSDPSSDDLNMMHPPDYFEEPSVIGDEDIRSQQLRQEIYDLNNRMVSAQNENDIVFRRNNQEDEIQSLGGQSV